MLPSQVMKQLLEATVIDVERSRMEKLLELLDEFFKETPLFCSVVIWMKVLL